jgi:hypothetical protein
MNGKLFLRRFVLSGTMIIALLMGACGPTATPTAPPTIGPNTPPTAVPTVVVEQQVLKVGVVAPLTGPAARGILPAARANE